MPTTNNPPATTSTSKKPDCVEPRSKSMAATRVVANLANVAIVLCGLFALSSVIFSPPELHAAMLRISFFTAIAASAVSIVAHATIWFIERNNPGQPHAVQHWLSAHAASIAGFIGANWMWFHP